MNSFRLNLDPPKWVGKGIWHLNQRRVCAKRARLQRLRLAYQPSVGFLIQAEVLRKPNLGYPRPSANNSKNLSFFPVEIHPIRQKANLLNESGLNEK